MRTLHRAKEPLTIKTPRSPGIRANDNGYAWNNATAQIISAVVQPLGGSVAATIYGQRVTQMLRLIYDGPTRLTAGMGVCVGVAANASCDYRISEPPENWMRHQRATLTLIPEGERLP